MTKKKHAARVHLKNSAHDLVIELWEGKWGHVGKKIHTKPIPKIRELTDELKARSPGHSLEEYQDAIARAYWENR